MTPTTNNDPPQPNDPLKFYISRWMRESHKDEVTESSVVRDDENGACIWVGFTPDVYLPTALRVEVYQGRLQVIVFDERWLVDDSNEPTIVVIAENYDEFLKKAKDWSTHESSGS